MEENLVALYILTQGYCVARRLESGMQPIPGVTLPAPSRDAVDRLLAVEEIGLTRSGLESQLYACLPETRGDARIVSFFESLGKTPPAPSLECADYMLQALESGARRGS